MDQDLSPNDAHALAIQYAGKAAEYAEVNSEHGAQQAQAYAATAQAYAAIAQASYLGIVAGSALRHR